FFVASIGGYDLMYFKNTPQNGKPHFERAPDNEIPFRGVVTTKWTVPLFSDLDKDGDTDAIFSIYIGGVGSQIRFYKNRGSATAPIFDEEPTDTKNWINDPTPVLGDMDGDGDLDLFVGNALGTLSYLFNNRIGTPGNIGLTPARVAEAMPAGTRVGRLSSSQPDYGDSHTYTLVSGNGDRDNARFRVQGEELFTTQVFNYETHTSFSIRLRATDKAGAYSEETVIISVVDDPTEYARRPTTITLSSSSILENEPANTLVGTLGNNDPDLSDTHTYALLSGGQYFKISGDRLLSKKAFNAESKATYTIRVRCTDRHPNTLDKNLAITIANQPERPTNITLSASTLDENRPAGTLVGRLSAQDPEGGAFTYALVSGAGDTQNAHFQISESQLKTREPLDHETGASQSVRIRCTDTTGLFFEKAFTITVRDLLEDWSTAPTRIALDSLQVTEQRPVGTLVGHLTTDDNDIGDRHTFTLVSGTGDDDNGMFRITKNRLETAVVFRLTQGEAALRKIRIKIEDLHGNTLEKAFTLTLQDGPLVVDRFEVKNRLENPMAPPVGGGDINGGFTIRPSLMDFDRDGDLDLYLSDHTKIRFYENKGTSTSPSFVDRSHDAKNLFSNITGPGHISQGFYDVDRDGLTDLILGNWTGGLYYYENRGTQQNPQYASYYWNPADARVSGHAAPTAADLNGNGRAEIYIGAENGKIRCFEVVRVLENSDNCMGWVFQAPEFEEKTGAHNPLSGISLSGRITPHLTDFDGDGDTDLFVGTQLGQVAYYKNTGTTSRPNFVRQQESSDLFRGIDLRGNAITNVATPTTGDLNGDGKKDVLVVVNDGDIRWFKNTGTTANPSLTQVTGTENPFGGVDLGQKTHPALIDNDGDGDLDLYVGVCRGIYTEGVTWGDDVGNNQGRIRYFKNVGTSSAPVYRQTPSENKFKTFSSKGVSKISFADVDGDNDKDAVIVDTYGEVFYYKNQAAPNATPHFVKKTGDKDPFHGLSSYPDSFYGPPAFADFDGDGDMDFFVASIGGYDLMYFKNTPQNGKPHFERAPDNEIPFRGVVTTKWTVP
ncbi:MAG: FG-GAP-like repeat-containing protein, partial [Desulfobacterales bacterium]|nr:FG-GAP-like repeat-containing protein [Desulfobacterales bacterium]